MEQQYDPTARTLLRITGVLMIIFGSLGILLYLLGLAAVIGLTYATSGVFSSTNDLIGMGLLLVCAISELITGILGVRTVRKPERTGKKQTIWGILTLVLSLAAIGLIALRNTVTPLWELCVGMLLSVVVPVTYLYAVTQIWKAPTQENEETP